MKKWVGEKREKECGSWRGDLDLQLGSRLLDVAGIGGKHREDISVVCADREDDISFVA